MTQKFIDRDGLKVLWKQASLQDYPNNETLMAVIDAIDEIKADKNELFSKSWNDLTDRPFYDDGTFNIEWDGTYTENTPSFTYINTSVNNQSLTMYKVSNSTPSKKSIMGASHDAGYFVSVVSQIVEISENLIAINAYGGAIVVCYSDGEIYNDTVVPEAGVYFDTSTTYFRKEIKKIDNKFLPSYSVNGVSLVADNDVDIRGDWNESNEDDANYIKNRTHYKYFEGFDEYILENCECILGVFQTSCSLPLTASDIFSLTDKCFLIVDGVEYLMNVSWEGDRLPIYTISSSDCTYYIKAETTNVDSITGQANMLINMYGFADTTTNDTYVVSLKNCTEKYKTLNEKYIPETIARKDDIYALTDEFYLKSEADTLHTEIEDYVDNQVAALVNSAPETLDTLGELATAFEENKEVVEALDASITNKQDKISDTLILVDTVTGIQHKIQIQNGQLVSFPVE